VSQYEPGHGLRRQYLVRRRQLVHDSAAGLAFKCYSPALHISPIRRQRHVSHVFLTAISSSATPLDVYFQLHRLSTTSSVFSKPLMLLGLFPRIHGLRQEVSRTSVLIFSCYPESFRVCGNFRRSAYLAKPSSIFFVMASLCNSLTS
jgi:hypothetical protein